MTTIFSVMSPGSYMAPVYRPSSDKVYCFGYCQQSFVNYSIIVTISNSSYHYNNYFVTVEAAESTKETKQSYTATIGLVIHSAGKSLVTSQLSQQLLQIADGIALGAAASADNTELELVIFIAIMLHKVVASMLTDHNHLHYILQAPAGFGLASFLIHEVSFNTKSETKSIYSFQGCDRKAIRYHLLAFSLAAPIAAFVSHYCFINVSVSLHHCSYYLVCYRQVVYASNLPITGLAMLFSAGTFLYVATVHVLTEISHNRKTTNHSSQSSPTHQNSNTQSSKLTIPELIAIVCGILMPILFNVFHHTHYLTKDTIFIKKTIYTYMNIQK